MFAYAGTVAPFAVTEWLVLALAFPIVLFLLAATGKHTKQLGFACLGASAAIVAWLAAHDRLVLQHLISLARIGFLDVGFDLALDPIGAALALVSCGVGIAWLGNQKTPSARSVMLMSAAIFGALVASLGDNLVLVAIGTSIGSTSAMIGARKTSAIGRLADVAVVLGAACVFWSFAGRFTPERFLPDLSPRVIAAAAEKPETKLDDQGPAVVIDKSGHSTMVGSTQAARGPAFLSFDGPSGALVYVDESKTAPWTSPIAHRSLDSGVHAFHVRPGSGSDDHVLSQIAFRPGADVTLAVLGPSLVFRHLNQQITFEPKPRRDDTLLAIGLACLLISALARVREAASLVAHPASLASAVCGALVFVRLSPLAQSLGRVSFAFAIASLVMMGLFVLRACASKDMRAICTYLSCAFCALALAGASVGSEGAAGAALVLAMPVLLVGKISEDPLPFTLPARQRTTSMIAALALTATPLPVVGASWVFAGALSPSLVLGSPVLALACIVLGALCAFGASFAVFRLHAGAFDTKKESKLEPFGVALALGVVVLSTLLACSPRVFGASEDGFVAHAPVVGVPALAAGFVLVGALFLGRQSALRRFSSRKKWQEPALPRIPALDGSVSLSFVSRISSAIDEYVIGFAVRAIGALAWAFGFVMTNVEDAPLGDRIASLGTRRVLLLCALVLFALFILGIR